MAKESSALTICLHQVKQYSHNSRLYSIFISALLSDYSSIKLWLEDLKSVSQYLWVSVTRGCDGEKIAKDIGFEFIAS